MIGLLSWLGCGLVVGVASKYLLPGGASWTAVLATALPGALAGGVAATLLDMGGYAELDVRGTVLAFLMAALAVLAVQLLRPLLERRNR